MKKTFFIKDLTCYSCGSKIEKKINALNYINNCNIDIPNQKINIDYENNYNFVEIKKIVTDIEPDVIINESFKEKKEIYSIEKKKTSNKIIHLSIALLLFIIAIIYKNFYIYTIAYIFSGFIVFKKSLKSFLNKDFFNENTLMLIATVGAFIIAEYTEAVGVMIFYNIGELIQHLAVNKSRNSIKSLIDKKPKFANEVVGGNIIEKSPEDVTVNSNIIVKPGEMVPIDSKLMDNKAYFDTSQITGESEPKTIYKNQEIPSGYIALNSKVNLNTIKIYRNSTIYKIIDVLENSNSKKGKTEKFITKFARYYTPGVLLTSLLVFIIPVIFLNLSPTTWLYRSLIFLVISCPCALLLSVPLAYFGGLGAGSKYGILIKGGIFLENFSNLKGLIFDKTGTLTKGKLEISEIKILNNFTKKEIIKTLSYAEYYSSHPISKAIKEKFNINVDITKIKDMNEIAGQGLKTIVENNIVLVGNYKMMKSNNIEIEQIKNFSEYIYIVKNKKLMGFFQYTDNLKKDSKETISYLIKNGITPLMLSGDIKQNTKKIAEKINITDYKAELSPLDKLDFVKKYNAKYANLAFVGDGLNDAPSIKEANTGLSMGTKGVDITIETSDIVIMNDNLENIVKLHKLAKFTKKIIIQNIGLALGIKFIIMILGTLGYSTMWHAVFADVGVAVLAVLNSIRIILKKF